MVVEVLALVLGVVLGQRSDGEQTRGQGIGPTVLPEQRSVDGVMPIDDLRFAQPPGQIEGQYGCQPVAGHVWVVGGQHRQVQPAGEDRQTKVKHHGQCGRWAPERALIRQWLACQQRPCSLGPSWKAKVGVPHRPVTRVGGGRARRKGSHR